METKRKSLPAFLENQKQRKYGRILMVRNLIWYIKSFPGSNEIDSLLIDRLVEWEFSSILVVNLL